MPRKKKNQTNPETASLKKPRSQKKILFFWYNNPIHSGARVHDYQLLLSLAELGHKVISYTNALPPFLRDYKDHKNVTWLVKADLKRKELKNADLVIASPGPRQPDGIKFAQEQKIPLWLFSYGPEKWWHDILNQVFNDEAVLMARYRSANLIITSSDMAREKFIEWIPDVQMKIEVVKPYIRFDKLPKKPIERKRNLTFCGRLQEYKGYKEFLQWGNEYCQKFKRDLTLNLIATGAQEEQGRWEIPFQPIDAIDEFRKFEIIAESLIGFVPSKFETFGLVPGEFLALKTPMIVLDIPQLRREYGDRLIYVKGKEDFFNAMNTILSGGYSCLGLERDKKNELSPERMIEQMKSLIEMRL